jgi:hypothetical protein
MEVIPFLAKPYPQNGTQIVAVTFNSRLQFQFVVIAANQDGRFFRYLGYVRSNCSLTAKDDRSCLSQHDGQTEVPTVCVRKVVALMSFYSL